MNSYELTRAFWDFAFSNPEKITPNHCAIYNFAIEHCNRLGWKEKFGFPTTMAMEAVGIKSYKTYIKAFNDLVDWGGFCIIERSTNQHSANIIALVKFTKAPTKALDKAMLKHVSKHTPKQVQSTYQSKSSINKQETLNQEPINQFTSKQTIPPFIEDENEIFTPTEIVSFVNEHYGKDFTERNLTRFDRDLINDLITAHKYSKDQVLQAWLNIKKNQFYVSKSFNPVTFRLLSDTKTIEQHLFWKDEQRNTTDKPRKTLAEQGNDLYERVEAYKRRLLNEASTAENGVEDIEHYDAD